LPAVPVDVQLLTGWGRTAPTGARVVDVGPDDVSAAVTSADGRGVLVRGLGRSYGDAAQNAGGTVLRLHSAADSIRVDAASGRVTAGAGTSFDELMRFLVPRGWFVPVTPGTRYVTLGGAIASDVHGKNHHVDGSFGNHVTAMRMVMADGSVRCLTPEADAELWWATIGGMGLTGAIIEAEFTAIPIATSRCLVDTTRAADLDELLAVMEATDHTHRYSVAWIDLLASGARLGRAVVTAGDHAPLDAVDAGDPLGFAPRTLASVPPGVPNVLNHTFVRAFNEAWFRKAPRRRSGEVQTIGRFFHPLDGVDRWNRLYGRGGFVQFQLVVPFGEEATLRTVIERVAGSGHASFLAVLKRFGPGNPAPLSFPTPGWTLTLDVPAAADGLGPLLHGLDELVLGAGGRHYFAKDAHTTPEAVRRGYPRLAEWQAARDRVDPDGRWVSDLARRLELVPTPD
jgi:decaprenylphospho-beta-D-ribofuranose 2-oxidase